MNALLVLLIFAILTLWIPGYWPVAVYISGLFLLSIIEMYKARRKDWLALLMVGLLAMLPLWGLVQIALGTTVYSEPTLVKTLETATYACVVYLASGIEVERWHVLRTLLWFGFVVAVLAILQNATRSAKVLWLFPMDDQSGYPMGPILYHNHWAVFVEVLLPVALWNAMKVRNNHWLYTMAAGTLYASVIMSASRSGSLICSIETLVVPVLVAMRGGILAAATKSAAAILAGLITITLITGPQTLLDRFRREDLTMGRRNLNQSSAAMTRVYGLHGAGLGNWPVVYPQYATFDLGHYVNEAHNDWAQWVVEGGLPCAAVFAALFAFSLWRSWRLPWLVGVAAVFCQAFVDYPFSRPGLAAWPLTLLGLGLKWRQDE